MHIHHKCFISLTDAYLAVLRLNNGQHRLVVTRRSRRGPNSGPSGGTNGASGALSFDFGIPAARRKYSKNYFKQV